MTSADLLQVAEKRLADLGVGGSTELLESLAAVVADAPATDHILDEDPGLDDDAGALGRYRWTLLAEPHKKSAGVYYTPAGVAAELASAAIAAAMPASVCDPAMGGGVFLLATADAMVSQGASPLSAFEALHGVDLDPVSVEVTRFCLGEWAWRHGLGWLDAGDRLAVADSLLVERWPVGSKFDLVIGNPPFAGQMLNATVNAGQRQVQLKERFGEAAQAYTDAAALFLLLSSQLSVNQILLVLPRSLLGARDAGAVRSQVGEKFKLVELWLGSSKEFNANVQLCALRFLRSREDSTVVTHGAFNAEATRCTDAPWAKVAALAAGTPEVEISARRQLSDIARITADFRDEYYALTQAVVEQGDSNDPGAPKLVTSGLIDPAHIRWGETTCRFAKQPWHRPVVKKDELPASKRRWFEARSAPKILVASQTTVIEPVVDEAGELIPATPVVTVTTERLWHVAALLCSPVATLALLYSTFGTAQGSNAVKVSAATLKELPVPDESEHWDHAAELFEQAQASSGQERRGLLIAVGEAMLLAFDLKSQESLGAWWAGRLPKVR